MLVGPVARKYEVALLGGLEPLFLGSFTGFAV